MERYPIVEVLASEDARHTFAYYTSEKACSQVNKTEAATA